MPPTTKENEALVAPPAQAASVAALPNDAVGKAQPVALEVAVTVNGARTVEGSDKREPFSESTKTVLVFGTGAVIRLSSSVAPGQLLFLTNEKTKKEVVCQVVKSKNYRSVSGYVELEFTEPVVGFWGMRFPGDRPGSAAQPAVSSPAAAASNGTNGTLGANSAPKPSDAKPAILAPAGRTPEPKISESKFVAPASPANELPATPKPITPLTPASLLPEFNTNSVPVKPTTPIPSAFDSPRAPESKASIFAPPPQAPAALPTVNVISLSSDSDLSADSARKDANSGDSAPANWLQISEVKDVLPPTPPTPQAPLAHPQITSDPETEALKQRTARLQEQLSSFAFSETPAVKPLEKEHTAPVKEVPSISDAASKVVELAHPEPERVVSKPAETPKSAPPPVKSLLDEEELKIPTWLEPLARNASAPASTQELVEREKARRLAEQQPKIEEVVSESFGATEEKDAQELPPPFLVSQPSVAEDHLPAESRSKSSGKGLMIAAIAAGVVLLAGGAWWFLRPQNTGVTVTSPVSKAATPSSAASAPVEAQPPQSQSNLSLQSNSAASADPVSHSAPAQSAAVVAAAPASTGAVRNASERSASNPAKSNKSEASSVPVQPAVAEPEPKKPVLGEVRLEAPVVPRHETPQDTSVADPGAALAEDQPESNSETLGAGLGVDTKQPAAPAAPVPTGGDVKPAKLISSVPPIYPALAKNQHVSGNVLVDALIDSNGHVTTMKVVSGPTLLHQAAMDALRQWKYQPAMLDGKPVPMHLTVVIQFRLQ
jgi:periplasmic protein TonB